MNREIIENIINEPCIWLIYIKWT